MHGDAGRELPSRGHDLAQGELVSVHREDRDGVAAGVDGVEETLLRVVGQRALRGEVVDSRAVQDTAETAGGVGPRGNQRSVVVPVKGDDLIAGRVVRLGEHRSVTTNGERRKGW